MPSPFPGMDPYLEDPGGWLDIHGRLITYLGDDLNQALAGRYVARAQERVVVEVPLDRARNIFPDVSLVARGTRRSRAGRVALAEHDEPVVVHSPTTEFHEAWIEIRDRTGRRVITVIEVLSPSNKARGSDGREQYLKKQREVIESQVHLVEIDLLRAGEWTLAVPEADARTVSPFDYLVSISRASDRARYELYPIPLEQCLPRIAIPLAGKDPDVVADLQSLLGRCYDRGQYRATIDYRRPPTPPLSPRQARWAAKVLRAPRASKRR